jgi:hypothetical protein
MSDASRQSHWENVYVSKGENEVSWFQESPSQSRTPSRLRPVQPVAGEHALLPLVDVDLNTVAIELDSMEPLVAGPSAWPVAVEARHSHRGAHHNNVPRTLGHHATQKASEEP